MMMKSVAIAVLAVLSVLVVAAPFLESADADSGTDILSESIWIDTDTSMDSLTVTDGTGVHVTNGAVLELKELVIATDGGTAAFSTEEGSVITVDRLVVEGIAAPYPVLTFSTPSTSISAKYIELDDKKTLNARVLFDDSLSVTIGYDTVVYSAEDSVGEISVNGSIDLKEYRERIAEIEKSHHCKLYKMIASVGALKLLKLDLDLMIDASYGVTDWETPFLMKDLHIDIDSHSRESEVYYSTLLTLGEVHVYPVDNRNMSIYIELPNTAKDGVEDTTRDEVRWFRLSADSIHVDQTDTETGDSLLVDVEDLDIAMHSGDLSMVGISIGGLEVDEKVHDGMTVTETVTSMSDTSLAAFGTIAELTKEPWRFPELAETIIGYEASQDSLRYGMYQSLTADPNGIRHVMEEASVDDLRSDASMGYPESHLKLDLESFEYLNDAGDEISCKDVSIDWEYTFECPLSADAILEEQSGEGSTEAADLEENGKGTGLSLVSGAVFLSKMLKKIVRI